MFYGGLVFAALLGMQFDFANIRACLYCGIINGNTLISCPRCWEKLVAIKSGLNLPVVHSSVRHVYLYPWNKKNEKLIRPLAYAIKGAPEPRIFDVFAGQILENYQQYFTGFKDIVFVPAPARQLGDVDHAMAFANSLKKVFSAKLWAGLKRVNGGSQRARTRKVREKTILQTKSQEDRKWIKNRKAELIVFVDDVFTSGSTARAAAQLFENKGNFLALSLIYKEFENVDFI